MRGSILLPLALLLLAPAALAQDKREEALAKIEALLDAGELDQAKDAIDHLLEHHPEDADLLRLKDEWRLRKGEVGPLLSGEGDERENLWRVVSATMRGNPEEWPALLGVREKDRVKALLERRRSTGSDEDRRVAADLLARLEAPAKPSPDRAPEELVAAIRKGPAECLSALAEAERRTVKEVQPLAREVFSKAEDPELKSAAAGVLLALGDDGPRTWLESALRSKRPVDAVFAVRALLRHPGPGKTPLRDLFGRIAEDEEILRVKPTLLALAVEALGRSAEPGTREFLESLLGSAQHRVDAARALGELGDAGAREALLAYLRAPPPREEEDATGRGLGYLGRATGLEDAAEAEELRPILVGAIALLRLPAKPR